MAKYTAHEIVISGISILAMVTILKLAAYQEPDQLIYERYQNVTVECISTLTRTMVKEPEIIVEEEPIKTETKETTTEERDLLIRLVIAEAGAEPFEGQCAVAQVVLDRVEHHASTITDIIYSPCQFTTPYAGDVSKFPDAIEATDKVLAGYRVFEEPTTYFFNPEHSKPAAVAGLRKYIYAGTIGRHEFRSNKLREETK